MDQIKMGKFIAVLRCESNLTQAQLGEELGVTNKTISRWENGHYAPDIEMLQLLSKKFNVTINEIISGERLSDESFKAAADKNLIRAWQESSFTLNEHISYWRGKWLKDNRARIVIAWLVFIAFLAFAVVKKDLLLLLCWQLGGIIIFLGFRNRMMAYVEKRAFKPEDNTRK